MKEFGWTIEYTLNLTFPVFFDLFGLIRRIRLDAAIDEFYTPYGAVKFGGKCAKHLFDGRGSYLLNEKGTAAGQTEEVTDEMIERARKKLRAIMERNQAKLSETASGQKEQ